ncbi:MAG TPA: hypothetical protein VMZ28_12625 [Kofleriaceae bacterium]|nr:hypothetical protein [Kofleriaceae bacterium]
MSTTIRFDDHPTFHRAALWMAGAGAMAALAAHVVSLLDPRVGSTASPLPMGLVAGAALFGAAPTAVRARGRDLAGVVVGAAVGAAALAAVQRGEMASAWGVAIFAAVLGVVAARGAGGRRFYATAAAAAGAIVAAKFAMTALAGAAWGPAWLVASAAGGAFGTVALLGTLPRHLRLDREPAASDDAAEILGRAKAHVKEPRVVDLLEQFGALERDAKTAPSAEVLTARAADLERRAAATSDALARAEYEKARDTVNDQLREVEGIRAGRERILARLHSTLEELDHTALAARSTAADITTAAALEE